jgi:hypothetical protein
MRARTHAHAQGTVPSATGAATATAAAMASATARTAARIIVSLHGRVCGKRAAARTGHVHTQAALQCRYNVIVYMASAVGGLGVYVCVCVCVCARVDRGRTWAVHVHGGLIGQAQHAKGQVHRQPSKDACVLPRP